MDISNEMRSWRSERLEYKEKNRSNANKFCRHVGKIVADKCGSGNDYRMPGEVNLMPAYVPAYIAE